MRSADTLWVLLGAALVLFMTPGLALFYGGMVRSKNVLSVMMNSFIAIGIITVVFVTFGGSLIFSNDLGAGLLGNLHLAGFANLNHPLPGLGGVLCCAAGGPHLRPHRGRRRPPRGLRPRRCHRSVPSLGPQWGHAAQPLHLDLSRRPLRQSSDWDRCLLCRLRQPARGSRARHGCVAPAQGRRRPQTGRGRRPRRSGLT